jgi:hypothetical protein
MPNMAKIGIEYLYFWRQYTLKKIFIYNIWNKFIFL